ncbi:glucokinase [Paenibacillus marchantiophytorum]|uniref:Glucokinase n=1 Tax=Paenibacillus marchantiophytorum TaxID=1619310 RepID=A0ABQ1EQY8_9BACL|nr:ROK family protein [Paenibacillus marchantiophytorum]GFZ83383.1 glucokinase [Paenibacillus marchantiophytorum]
MSGEEKQDGSLREYYVGVDLGGTKMLAALVASDGSIIAQEEIPTLAKQGADSVLDRLGSLIEGLLAASPGGRGIVRGIGVATAGTLDTAKGVVTYASNLGWRDVAVASVLSDRFACAVRLENDATAAAAGEWLAGAGEGSPDCLFVTISTGIGGGIISGGRLIAGTNHNAGELGHITIDGNGMLCPCGNVGCLELYASGTAIGRRGAEHVRRAAEGASSHGALARLAGGDPDRVDARLVAAAAAEGDADASGILREAGRALGIGLVSIFHLLNPQVVVLGGGASHIGEPLLAPMREIIEERCLPSIRSQVRFVASALGSSAGAVGAALLMTRNDN